MIYGTSLRALVAPAGAPTSTVAPGTPAAPPPGWEYGAGQRATTGAEARREILANPPPGRAVPCDAASGCFEDAPDGAVGGSVATRPVSWLWWVAGGLAIGTAAALLQPRRTRDAAA